MLFSIETISAVTEKGCISIASGAISFRGNFFAAQNPWNFEDDRWTQVVTFKVVEIASKILRETSCKRRHLAESHLAKCKPMKFSEKRNSQGTSDTQIY